MDLPSGHPSSDTEWVLEILPPMASAGEHVQPILPGDYPRSSATIVYNRTVLSKNYQRGDDVVPTFRRRTIAWDERLCLELVRFFGDWFLRHQELIKNSSAFLMKTTYFANFADVLRAYPRLDGPQPLIRQGLSQTVTEQMEVSAEDPIPVDFADRVSRGGMSPLGCHWQHRRIETPSIIEESPEDGISKSTAACASFLIEGLQAELSASQ
ncbi:hypothetical protein PSHT_15495 [Puccinia striiformis]|uniref:Uncharacterized protein n=1 Tax=Puccinia striiformis TaxID=27350 RepID=A0A2S4UEJ3_9BASI|nr:hypothetical protein PSHT_15495 [Puccinia striiformis]